MTADRATSKPLLLIDVDGVLNCFGDLGRSTVSFEAEFIAAGRYRIKVPAGAAEALHWLSDAFVCVWASTWQALAHSHIGTRLGIDAPWSYVVLDDDLAASGPTAKLAAVARYAADRPLAWVDDDLHDDAHRWVAERQRQGLATLLIQPEVNIGLTRDHVDTLLGWASARREERRRAMDIRSSASHPAGTLSNMAAHRFTFRDRPASSMEGLLQSLKYPDVERQREIMGLAGKQARKAGASSDWQAAQRLFWQRQPLDRHGPAYQQLLDEAYSSLFAQNRRAREALLETGDAPLAHSLGSTDPRTTVLTAEEFTSRLARERLRLRRAAAGRPRDLGPVPTGRVDAGTGMRSR